MNTKGKVYLVDAGSGAPDTLALAGCAEKIVVGTLTEAAKQSAEGPALIMIGRVPEKAQHIAPHAESDGQTDGFLEYGNSWFR